MRGKIIALIFLGLGVFLLLQVLLPVISFKIWEIQNSQLADQLINPEADAAKVLGVSISTSQEDNFPAFISSIKRKEAAPYQQFEIEIPTINIKTDVSVDSNDLKQGLAHLPGTALPGEKGNMFISGHSALPQFFKASEDEEAIFAHLPNLKKGDKIKVRAGQTEFNYQVVGFQIVNPKDLSVVAPPDQQGRYISLMTCVPPGLNTKRLVVLGRLI